jgi:hypothetical protein
MKRTIIISALLLSFAFIVYGQDNQPGPKASFIPKDWKVIQEAYGDLNKDSIDDAALAIEYTGEQEADDERPRSLIILFQDKSHRYTQATRADHILLGSESGGTLGDPFSSMEIKRNVLRIDFEGGSREKWTTTHRYRYNKDNYFSVIGATYSLEDMGATTTYDYNLSNGNIIITTKDATNKAKNKTVNKSHKISPIVMAAFEPDAVWAMLMPENAKVSKCVLNDVGLGDCYHLIFDCGDFGNAETYLDDASQKLWESMSVDANDETVVNPLYKGKPFEITYIEKTGLRCDPQGVDPYQLVIGFRMIK